jgi:hypothetical protein
MSETQGFFTRVLKKVTKQINLNARDEEQKTTLLYSRGSFFITDFLFQKGSELITNRG